MSSDSAAASDVSQPEATNEQRSSASWGRIQRGLASAFKTRGLLQTVAAVAMVLVALLIVFYAVARDNEPREPRKFVEEPDRDRNIKKVPHIEPENRAGPPGVQAIANEGEARRLEQPDAKAQEVVVVSLHDWAVEADPGRPLDGPEQPIPIRVGKGHLTAPSIIFPTTPSAFIAVDVGEHEPEYEVWNYREGRREGTIRIKGSSNDAFTLSDDGKYLAIRRAIGNPIEVWTTADNQCVRPIAEQDLNSSLHLLGFVGNRLLTFDGRKGVFNYHDLGGGERATEIRFKRVTPKGLALSPGKRLVALQEKSSIYLVDLAVKPTAIELPLPAELGSILACQLRFSPAGNEVAALISSLNHTRMVSWSVMNGSLQMQHTLQGTRPTSREPRDFEWVADGSGWLLADGTFVAKSVGGPAASLTSIVGKDRMPLRTAPSGRLLVLSTFDKQRTLESLEWPQREVLDAVERFAQGARPDDQGFPPLMQADLAQMRRLTHPANAVAWRFELPANAIVAPKIVSSLRLTGQHRELRDVFTGISAPKALVEYGPANSDADPANGRHWFEICDLLTGQPLAPVDISSKCEVLAIDSDVSHFILRSAAKDRIDVMCVEGNKHIAGWRPYAQHNHWSKSQVAWAAPLDANHVLTANAMGSIVLWKIPECQAVYEYRANPARHAGIKPVLSPDGKYLAVAGDHQIHLLHAMTGECHGQLPTGGIAPVSAMAFDPQGRRLAAALNGGELSLVKVWRLEKGDEQAEVPLHKSASNLAWCGDDHLLCNGNLLADLKQSVVVWKYEVISGRTLATNGFGRCWYLSSASTLDHPILIGVSLPDDSVSDSLKQMAMPTPVLPANAPVRLALNLRQFPDAVSERLSARLRAQLVENRHEVVGDAPFKLAVEVSEAKTHRPLALKPLPPGLVGHTPSVLVDVSEVKVQLVLFDQAGGALWQNGKTFSTREPTGAHLLGPDELLGVAHSQTLNDAAAWLDSLMLPRVLHSPENLEGLGESHLTPEGPKLHHRRESPSASQPKRTGLTK